MKFYRAEDQKGFTLMELMVVIAIIGLLATVVLGSLQSGRMKGRNSARIQQIKEYQKAFALAYSDNQRYPNDGALTSEQHCLGKYQDTNCWGSSGVTDVGVMDAEVKNKYMLGWPPLVEVRISTVPSGYGLIYTEAGANTGSDYQLNYVLEGTSNCIAGATCSDCVLAQAQFVANLPATNPTAMHCRWRPSY